MTDRTYRKTEVGARYVRLITAAFVFAHCPLRFKETNAEVDAQSPEDSSPVDSNLDAALDGGEDGGEDGGALHDSGPMRCVPSDCNLDCADYVRGPAVNGDLTTCFSYTGVLDGHCSSEGLCLRPSPSDCAALPQGRLLAYCSSSCVRSDHACIPGGPASAVSITSMCALGTRTSSCTGPVCVESAVHTSATLVNQSCDMVGRCTGTVTDCNNYRCTPDRTACLMSCMSADDCLTNVPCQGTQCSL